MKKVINPESLKTKLVGIFLVLSIVPLIVNVFVISYFSQKGFTELSQNQQKEMENIVQGQFEKVANDLNEITAIYAKNEAIVSAFQSGDRNILLQEVNQIFPRLQEEHGLNVLEFGDVSGTVFLRGHEPEEFGDDKSGITAIQSALDGESISGFEFGESGLSVRAFAPIVFSNEVIGTLQAGIDDEFLNDINDMLQGITIDLYNPDGEIAVSSDKERIGQTIGDSSLLASIMEGERISSNNDGNFQSYLPMKDPIGSEIIGVIGIQQDVSVIQDTKQQILIYSLIIAVSTLIVVLFVSFKYSQSISNPIKKLADSMVALSKGNLDVPITKSKRNDEIGKLEKTAQVMKDNLHDTIEKVANASTSVAAQSEELTESANEVKSGADQIAKTMQEVASGTEKQADKLSDLASSMGIFTTTINETNLKGEQIQSSSAGVLDLTNKGKQLMKTSNEQMTKIDGIVQDAVKKMDELDNQTQEISKLVSIIQEVADQTNLLALNAAIEAARAGEHGKGFAVVAEEVRKLAEQVSVSVTDITRIVSNIQNESTIVVESLKDGYTEVNQGSAQIRTTGETFNEISHSVKDMVDNIKNISENLSEIAASTREMNETIEEIASISEESAASVEQTAATTQQSSSAMEEVTGSSSQLARLAEELNDLVKHFKLK